MLHPTCLDPRPLALEIAVCGTRLATDIPPHG